MRCLIVEDQQILLDLLSKIVASFTEVTDVFKATSCQEANALLQREPIDLAILDLQLPDGDGSDIGDILIRSNPNTHLIILSGSAESFICPARLRDAVKGIIDKRHSFEALRECLHDILKPLHQTLTRRQQEVFHLIGEGKSTKEIALILNSASSTIESHRKAISQKLNMSGAELIREASLTRQIFHQP